MSSALCFQACAKLLCLTGRDLKDGSGLAVSLESFYEGLNPVPVPEGFVLRTNPCYNPAS